jgi:hypothetical protein
LFVWGTRGAYACNTLRRVTDPGASAAKALALQKPKSRFPDDALRIVARGKKEDGPDGD